MNDILKYCKNNPAALTCVFPFIDTDGSIKSLTVKNPFFDEERAPEIVKQAAKNLFEAPKKLKELSKELQDIVAAEWQKRSY